MTREEAIDILNDERIVIWTEPDEEEIARKQNEAIDMAIEALSAEPTVIRSKTLMPTKDFKEWAKRVREENPNAIIIPCDAEVVSSELTLQTPQTYGKSINPSNAEVVADLISRADAIKAIESRQTEQWIDADVDYNNGLESAVAEIKALPSAEQVTGKLNNPCDSLLKADSESCKEQKSKLDLISRADAIDAVCNDWCYVTYENCPHIGDGYRTDGCDSVEAIKQLPSADRPSGEWVIVNKGLDIYICDQCGEVEQIQRIPIWGYCPNCGAKMKGESDECK